MDILVLLDTSALYEECFEYDSYERTSCDDLFPLAFTCSALMVILVEHDAHHAFRKASRPFLCPGADCIAQLGLINAPRRERSNSDRSSGLH